MSEYRTRFANRVARLLRRRFGGVAGAPRTTRVVCAVSLQKLVASSRVATGIMHSLASRGTTQDISNLANRLHVHFRLRQLPGPIAEMTDHA